MDISVSTIETRHQAYMNLEEQLNKLKRERQQQAKALMIPIINDLVDKLRITSIAVFITNEYNDEGGTYESVRYHIFHQVADDSGVDVECESDGYDIDDILETILANILAKGTNPDYQEANKLLASPAGQDLKGSLIFYRLPQPIRRDLTDLWDELRPVKHLEDPTWRFGEREDFNYE